MVNFKNLTLESWTDLKLLFGDKGACGGCWCMYWRLLYKEYEQNKGFKNQQAFKKLMLAGRPLGVLAFQDNVPMGWCSVSPKTDLIRLKTSRLLKVTEMDKSIWSITCLFIQKEFRRRGLSTKLIKAAVNYAYKHGAAVVEAYPIQPKKENMPGVFAWVGFVKAFKKAGFKKFLQVSETRMVMRLTK